MPPWFWFFWAPQVHWPLSGAVTQDFFASFPATAGDATIEREVFSTASYGRQIGWLTELLLAAQPGADAEARSRGAAARERLQAVQDKVDALKALRGRDAQAEAERALDRLGQTDADALRRVLEARLSALPAAAASRRRLPSR